MLFTFPLIFFISSLSAHEMTQVQNTDWLEVKACLQLSCFFILLKILYVSVWLQLSV